MRDLKALAEMQGISVNGLVNLIISSYFGRNKMQVVFDHDAVPETVVEKAESKPVQKTKDDDFSLFKNPVVLQNFEDDDDQ